MVLNGLNNNKFLGNNFIITQLHIKNIINHKINNNDIK